MGFLSALLGGLCIHCASPEQATTAPKGGLEPRRLMALAVGDGCARLHIKVGPGSAATVTAVDQGSACRADELEVRADSEPVFDAATGVLRLAIVLKNLGTIAMGAPARLTFVADSANLFDQNGNLLPGKPDITAQNADSANASGRIGVWRWDAYLAPNGATQVLAAGATSQRRWLEFHSPNWNNAIRISLSASTVEPSPNVVPLVAPDTLPRGLTADSNLVPVSATSRAQIVRDHIIVFFRPTATQAQRQQALDAVSGTVVGGFRLLPAGSEGGYLVRLPSDPTHQRVRAAVDLLSNLASVRFATLYYVNYLGDPTYRRPEDLGAWGPNAWRISASATFPFAAARQTWALEAISGPLAWGCSVGDSTVRVAVIDQGFKTAGMAGDEENVVAVDVDNVAGDPLDHGSRVASVIGARGNNRSGMTGVTWRVALDLRDVTLRDSTSRAPRLDSLGRRRTATFVETFTKLNQAVAGGARILNISLGADIVPILQRDAEGVREASAINEQVQIAAVDWFNGRADPLLVVSSGNIPNGDPFGSMWPNLKDSLESRVLVVTAINADGTLRSAPPNSPLIDLAAPGEQVGVLSGGLVQTTSGASVATPLVAGIAGLLLAFDSTLTAADLRALILDGARRSGRVVGGYPVPDAYESLKLAAERSGRPLCGNRVWARDGTLFAQRGPLDLAGEPLIAEAPGTQIAAIDVQHGGREIRYTVFAGYNTETGTATPRSVVFDDASRTWRRGPDPFIGLDTASAGAARSYRVQSHDGDTVVTVAAGHDGNGADILFIQLSDALSTRSSTITLGAAGLPFTYCSAILLGSCDQTNVAEPLDGFRRVAAAYPPVGDTMLVAVSRLAADTQSVQTPGTCRGAPCTTVELRYFLTPQRADLYKVALSSDPFQATLVRSISDSIIYHVGYSEDGREKVLSAGRSIDTTAAPTHGFSPSFTVLTCRLEWSSPTWSSLAPLHQIAPASACPGLGFAADIGAGTFAPRRRADRLTGGSVQRVKPRHVSTQRRH